MEDTALCGVPRRTPRARKGGKTSNLLPRAVTGLDLWDELLTGVIRQFLPLRALGVLRGALPDSRTAVASPIHPWLAASSQNTVNGYEA